MTASIKTFALLLVIIIHGFNLHAQNQSQSAAQIEKGKSDAAGRASNNGGVLRATTAFYSEDFAGGVPAGWTIIDSISPSNGEIWLWSDTIVPFVIYNGVDSFSTNGTTAANGYMIYDSDGYGNNTTLENTSLRSPPISCAAQSSVHLGFNHYYRDFINSVATVYVGTDTVNWFPVRTFNATTTNPEGVDIDISSIAANHDSVYLLFQYTGSWGWYWMLDDIQLADAATIGINENTDYQIMPLYPNPSTGRVTYTPTTSAKQTLTIYNVSGQLVYENTFENSLNKNLDLSKFEKGIYTVRVVTNESSNVQRLILID